MTNVGRDIPFEGKLNFFHCSWFIYCIPKYLEQEQHARCTIGKMHVLTNQNIFFVVRELKKKEIGYNFFGALLQSDL